VIFGLRKKSQFLTFNVMGTGSSIYEFLPNEKFSREHLRKLRDIFD
jgi:hypothetical protein